MTHAAAALPAPAHRTAVRAGLRTEVLCGAGVALLSVLVFANALANGFVLDDRGIVLGNPLVQNWAQSWRAFLLPYWPEGVGGGQYRPLAILHFALDWRLGGGTAVWFHAVNVMWHALTTVLVWRLAKQLMRPWAAVACAALFAVHPVHVEAVANVVGRLECMATVFALGVVLAHRASSWLALPLLLLGVLSKENAIVAVALVLANDLLLERPALRRRRWLYVGYAVVVAAYAATLVMVFHDQPFRVMTGTLVDASLGTRLWTMASVVPHYVRLLIAPAALSADYEPQVIRAASGLTAAGAVGLMLLGSYVAALVLAWRRHPPLAFALAWVALALAPVANILFVSGVTLAERSLYLPSVGAVLALGIALDAGVRHRLRLTVGALAAALLAGAVRTWTRTPTWHDDRTYVLTLLADHPESYRAHWVAGRVYRAAGQLDLAERELEIARRLYGRSPRLYVEAAGVAQANGRTGAAVALRDTAVALARPRR